MNQMDSSLDQNQLPLTRELEELMHQTMKHPGVADVMKAYGQYEDILVQTEAYLGALNAEFSFAVTDSTSA
jgi:hypothetical protein